MRVAGDVRRDPDEDLLDHAERRAATDSTAFMSSWESSTMWPTPAIIAARISAWDFALPWR